MQHQPLPQNRRNKKGHLQQEALSVSSMTSFAQTAAVRVLFLNRMLVKDKRNEENQKLKQPRGAFLGSEFTR
jgi:hypothetical protein